MRMPRLYLQQGLSDRVVNAVVRRLERVLNMSSGAGDRMDAVVEETRTRSRSPRGGPGAEHASAPDGTGDAVPAPELGVPMPDVGNAVPDPALPLPEGAAQPEPPKLTEQLTQCLNKLGSQMLMTNSEKKSENWDSSLKSSRMP